MNDIQNQPPKISSAQWGVIALIVAFAAGSVLYKLLMQEHLGHSAAMFVGIPAVLAVILALSPKTKSATGGIIKGITLALLIVAPLLGEGYLCILIASPLFYVVGIVVGLIADHFHRKDTAARLSCAALLLVPVCLEGVIPQLTFNRAQWVEVSQTVPLSQDAVEYELAKGLKVATPLPAPLRIGFPFPLSASGIGLQIGNTRTIHFSGAEGDPPGDLILRIAQRRPGYARFETVSDGSKLTQWVRWHSSEVEWKALDADHTAVTWRIHFERQLDPAWYFTPWERFAMRQAAAYLIHANITERAN
jgi:hypothetical protein